MDVSHFLKLVEVKKDDLRKSRENIIQKIRSIVEEVHQIESIEIFGSYKTNLDLPWSDIDFVVFSQLFESSLCLNELNDQFVDEKEKSDWITKIDYISSASVPIIKLETMDWGNEIKVDVTFGDNTHKGSQWVELVKKYLSFYPILGHIVMIIKQLLKVKNLNDPYSGGISSYAITLMVVAFLQFQKLYWMGGYPVYEYLKPYQMNHADLGYTIFQFLTFYTFYVDFKKWDILPLKEEAGLIPPGSSPIANSSWPDEKLNIIDPLNPENNVGKSSFKIDEIKQCFKEAWDVLSPYFYQYNYFTLNQGSTADKERYLDWKNKLFDGMGKS